ncbi:MAG TPA: 3-oxoadipate enol-lactonase [Myxococcaceae bacterium]|nr:3-oxoadipate enol-lactonase [Myxococcaceae bacterium]
MADSNGLRLSHAPTETLTLSDGAHLAYRWDGPEGAPVLLLSNSLGTHLGMWGPQVPLFAERFRVLRYDTRGHGRSAATPGAYSMDRLGRDVIELLEATGVSRAHVCGLSLGGMVGQWLAVFAPDRLGRLVLANTSPYMGPPSAWQARIETVRQEGMEALAEGSLSRWFTRKFLSSHPLEVAAVREMLLACNRGGYIGCCAAIRDMDLRPLAQLIRVPTLLIVGREDPSTTHRDAALLEGPMPNPPRRVELQAAHLSNVEQPEAFGRAVVDFLS